MEKFFNIIALAGLLGFVVFNYYDYRESHIPEFETLQATVEYQQCIERCRETCIANHIPLNLCDCRHCNVYRMGG